MIIPIRINLPGVIRAVHIHWSGKTRALIKRIGLAGWISRKELLVQMIDLLHFGPPDSLPC